MSFNKTEEARNLYEQHDVHHINAKSLRIGTDTTKTENFVFGNVDTTAVAASTLLLGNEDPPVTPGLFQLISVLHTLDKTVSIVSIANITFRISGTRVNNHVTLSLNAPAFLTTAAGQIVFPADTIPLIYRPTSAPIEFFGLVRATATGFYSLVVCTVDVDGSMVIALLAAYGAASGNFANATNYKLGQLHVSYRETV